MILFNKYGLLLLLLVIVLSGTVVHYKEQATRMHG